MQVAALATATVAVATVAAVTAAAQGVAVARVAAAMAVVALAVVALAAAASAAVARVLDSVGGRTRAEETGVVVTAAAVRGRPVMIPLQPSRSDRRRSTRRVGVQAVTRTRRAAAGAEAAAGAASTRGGAQGELLRNQRLTAHPATGHRTAHLQRRARSHRQVRARHLSRSVPSKAAHLPDPRGTASLQPRPADLVMSGRHRHAGHHRREGGVRLWREAWRPWKPPSLLRLTRRPRGRAGDGRKQMSSLVVGWAAVVAREVVATVRPARVPTEQSR